jgi:3D (Asp-Asp-Asp) domain-containing protein
MSNYIRASRLATIIIVALLLWNEIDAGSLYDTPEAEAASAVVQQRTFNARGEPPDWQEVQAQWDILVVQSRPAPSPTPTPVPPTPTPAPTFKDLGVFKVTAYSDSPYLNGTDGRGITRSGERTHWGVVAVDPAVIPLGSRLQIDGMGDTVFTALDTGGGIRGRWVDIWHQTDWDAIQHGVKDLTVHLLE